MSDLTIEIKGLDKLMQAFQKFPREIARTMSQAGHEAGKEVIESEGLKDYPGMTAANRPPTPYYLRGTGIVYKSYTKTVSENMKKQWYVKREGYKTRIGNRASYAKYVHGDEQARAMKRIGWRKLFDVTKEKLPAIQKIYQHWVDRTIRRLGL